MIFLNYGGGRVKKWILILLIVIVLIHVSISFSDAYWLFDEMRADGNLHYCLHENKKVCYVSHLNWPGDADTVELFINDEFDGYRIISLGGYHVLTRFVINLESMDGKTVPDLLPEDAVVQYKHLIINIGKNIERIRIFDLKNYHIDSKTGTYYQVLVTINCAEGNEYFYAEDGKLFYKRTGSLVDDFYYYSDYVDE